MLCKLSILQLVLKSTSLSHNKVSESLRVMSSASCQVLATSFRENSFGCYLLNKINLSEGSSKTPNLSITRKSDSVS